MQFLLYGGSGSGKSALAEHIAQFLSPRSPHLYVATMWPHGAEAKQRIQKHRQAREGKGFTTVEQYTQMETLAIPKGAVVLLECLGNWVANEMFAEGGAGAENTFIAIERGLSALAAQAEHLVVVSNEVGCDGFFYPPVTLAYQRLVAALNTHLAAQSETVVEMVCGIPLLKKGELPCPY